MPRRTARPRSTAWRTTGATPTSTNPTSHKAQHAHPYLYDAFGQPLVYDASGQQSRGQASAVLDNRSLWAAGYEWYPEIGLYHCGARFYNPTGARWLQPDPLGQAGGLNLYAYCHNDPVNGTDPSGLADGPDILDDGNGHITISNGRVLGPGPLGPPEQPFDTNNIIDGSGGGIDSPPQIPASGGTLGTPSTGSNQPFTPGAPGLSPMGGGNGIFATPNPKNSAPLGSRDNIYRYIGVPLNSFHYMLPTGKSFYSPPGTNFDAMAAAGAANGHNLPNYWSQSSQFGSLDLQRNMGAGLQSSNTNVFYGAYTNASNYAIGAFGGGSPFPFVSMRIPAIGYGVFNSSNGPFGAQGVMQNAGWNAYRNGGPKAVLVGIFPWGL